MDVFGPIHTNLGLFLTVPKQSKWAICRQPTHQTFVPIFDINTYLDRLGYSFLFGTGKVKLYQELLLIGTRVLCGNPYILESSALPSVFATIFVNTVSSTKCLRLNEKSSILLHKLLSHIFKLRMERLIKDRILPDLDFSYFDTCVDCIKGKLTANIRNAKVDRCIGLLGVIHIDIYGHSPLLIWVATNISSRSLMIIPVMVLLSSFMKSLTLWRLSKL